MSYNVESPTDEGKHLWSHLLEEVRENAAVKLSPQRCLFVIGDSESGKTTLISRLQGSEDVSKSYGLEYQYIDVKDEDRDAQTKLGVYILDGNIELSRLTKFALNEKNFSDCLGIIVVSLQEPWKIMDTLHDLYGALKRHTDRLKIDGIDRNQLKQSLVQYYREYIEPNAAGDSGLGAYQSVTNNPPVLHGTSRRHNNPLHPLPSQLNGSHTDESTNIPLPANVLVENLGLPLIVVVTKTDVIEQFEKDKIIDEEQLEIIQMYIRRFCLERGAALFYTSVKEDKNCDLLKKYILHRVYGFPFHESAYVVEKDCVFVPCGWDNQNKIKIIEESLVNFKDKCNDFSKCIRSPYPTTQSSTMTNTADLIASRDEQIFLEDIKDKLENVSKMPSQGSPLESMNYQLQQNRSQAGHNRSTAAAQMNAMKSRGYAAGTVTNPGVQSGEGVLANFFNSLLKKTNTPNIVNSNTPPLSSSANINSSSSSVISDNGVSGDLKLNNSAATISTNSANTSQQEEDVS